MLSIGLMSGTSMDGINSALIKTDGKIKINEIADTILPTTSSPGAKTANVGKFMSVMVFDCYEASNQKIFMEGLKKIDELSEKKFGNSFVKATAAQRTELLQGLDKEQKEYQATKTKEAPSHYFRMMKELSVLGYFSSKEGATQALRYLPIPGKYDGSFPYKKGDKAWAT